jgi:cation diffusion facilitator family transporter
MVHETLSSAKQMSSDEFFNNEDVSIAESSADSGLSNEDERSLLAFSAGSKTVGNGSSNYHAKLNSSMEILNKYGSMASESETATLDDTLTSDESRIKSKSSPLRRMAIDLSLYLNLFILFSKIVAYINTLSLSVLAALIDSLLDVISQLVLNYTEKHSTKSRSSAHYPAGAARLEPVGVLTCAALMGMASFEILKESIESLVYDGNVIHENLQDGQNMASVYGMSAIVIIKLALYFLCDYSRPSKCTNANTSKISVQNPTNNVNNFAARQSVKVSDPTLEALAQDHWNDALSNAIAAIALVAVLISKDLWFVDPIGAIIISLYIIYSWYETGKVSESNF